MILKKIIEALMFFTYQSSLMISSKGAERLHERVRRYALTWYNKTRKGQHKVNKEKKEDHVEALSGFQKMPTYGKFSYAFCICLHKRRRRRHGGCSPPVGQILVSIGQFFQDITGKATV